MKDSETYIKTIEVYSKKREAWKIIKAVVCYVERKRRADMRIKGEQRRKGN